MSEIKVRTTPADLEVRSDGRTVVGICVPFDCESMVSDGGAPYREKFQRGAFARTIAERGGKVKFLGQHQRQAMPLGRATLLREDAAGLYGEFHVSKTSQGDEALELIRDGALDALSVGFAEIPGRDLWSRDRRSVVRQEVRLREVSAVSFPAYEGASILGVRSLDEPEPLTLELARRRLALLERRIR